MAAVNREHKSTVFAMLYENRIREYSDQKELPLDEAVDRAVTECIKEGILAEFLEENRR